jgi:hypothetical protein
VFPYYQAGDEGSNAMSSLELIPVPIADYPVGLSAHWENTHRNIDQRYESRLPGTGCQRTSVDCLPFFLVVPVIDGIHISVFSCANRTHLTNSQTNA